MIHVIFTVHLSGYGKTVEDAWDDAVESFTDDPGSPHDEPFHIDDDYDDDTDD